MNKFYINFKFLSLRNFMSYGNNYTTLKLDAPGTTLITGRNVDSTEGETSGNGCGKSTILNALTFALYDNTIESINKDSLVNLTNKKNLEIVVTFEIQNKTYLIKRARKCKSGASGNFVLIYESNSLYDDETHVSFLETLKGNPTELQETTLREHGFRDMTLDSISNCNDSIANILGIPFELFIRIVVFSSNHTPFLSLPTRSANGENQSSFMEELFNLTILTEKADSLKELIKATEQNLKNNQQKIELLEAEKERHETQITNINNRVENWNSNHNEEIEILTKTINDIGEFDFEKIKKQFEIIDNHKKDYTNNVTDIKYLEKEIDTLEKEIINYENSLSKIKDNIKNWDEEYETDLLLLKEKIKKIHLDDFEEIKKQFDELNLLKEKLQENQSILKSKKIEKENILDKINNYDRSLKKITKQYNEWNDDKNDDVEHIKNQIDSIVIDDFDELKKLYEYIDKLKIDIAEDTKQLSVLNKEIDTLKDETEHKHHELIDLGNDTCPYCKQTFKESKEKVEEIKKSIVDNNLKIQESTDRIDELAKTIQKLRSKKDSIEEELPLPSLDDLITLKAKKDKFQNALDQKINEKNPYESQLEDLKEQSSVIDEYAKEIDTLSDEIEKYESLVNKQKKSFDTIKISMEYDSIDELMALKSKKDKYQVTLDNLLTETNPFKEQLIDLKANGFNKEEHKNKIDELYNKIDELKDINNDIDDKCFKISSEIKFDNINEMWELKSKKDKYENALEKLKTENNPHLETLNELKAVKLENIDYSVVDELNSDIKHQKFLLKLLTKKDSFVRKALLDKNIPFLNNRLDKYLKMLKLPHTVKFTPEMNAEIFQLGRQIEFGNLSNGQKARINIALSLSFRDVLQSMHGTINICILDEILDNALDGNGVICAAKMLKLKANDDKLSLYIISHREEIENMFDKIMTITLNKGFSYISFEY